MTVNHTSRNAHKPRPAADSNTAPTRILAVDPGSRYMGIAFLIGTDLVRAGVENLREPGMRLAAIAWKADRVLSGWIRRYQPDVLAIETPGFAQSKRSVQLRRLVTTLTAVGRRQHVRVQLYPPTTTRKFVCRHGRTTRLAVARTIASDFFPWLEPYYQKEAARAWWRPRYWTRLFDAIAVGLMATGRLPDSQTPRQAA